MSFIDAIKSAIIENYFNFSGRARRSEYNYFLLFNILIAIGFSIIATLLASTADNIFAALTSLGWLMAVQGIVYLLLFIPSIALAVRRLHDINRTGWMLLVMGFFSFLIIPYLVLLYWVILKEGDSGPNNYGDPVK
ncbi:MAG: DUF805 domain-containing protein [SAR202 cluster bacterium]|nr:DUF805 domain-containing protein [SAR202 cluster bacterium]|tara:strand:- start:20 stop:427 length:408 start_codon:yes stop_codon:yes gene_type:complete